MYERNTYILQKGAIVFRIFNYFLYVFTAQKTQSFDIGKENEGKYLAPAGILTVDAWQELEISQQKCTSNNSKKTRIFVARVSARDDTCRSRPTEPFPSRRCTTVLCCTLSVQVAGLVMNSRLPGPGARDSELGINSPLN